MRRFPGGSRVSGTPAHRSAAPSATAASGGPGAGSVRRQSSSSSACCQLCKKSQTASPMCLIAVAWRTHRRYPLVVIANRDELHARPAAAAGFDPEAGDVYGGRDLSQGGSWLQVSTRGRLAAVTNVRAGIKPEARPRSRGWLVRDFVRGDQGAVDYGSSLERTAAEYGRYNLLLWDGSALAFASNHPNPTDAAVSPGLHAMSNGAFDAAWPKGGRATSGPEGRLA